MFHEAQSRAQAAMVSENSRIPFSCFQLIFPAEVLMNCTVSEFHWTLHVHWKLYFMTTQLLLIIIITITITSLNTDFFCRTLIFLWINNRFIDFLISNPICWNATVGCWLNNFQTEEAKSLTKTKSSKKKGNGQHPPTIKTIELGCYEVT
jgi:hypothetical protein